MNITQHKSLIAQIPEDLNAGEPIEYSDDGKTWKPATFQHYGGFDGRCSSVWVGDPSLYDACTCVEYARRPAPALKRLKEEPVEYPCIYCGAGNSAHHSYSCRTKLHPDRREEQDAAIEENTVPADHSADASKKVENVGTHECEMVLVPGVRWYRIWTSYSDKRRLQQQWRCSCGKSEWRDVPEVEE